MSPYGQGFTRESAKVPLHGDDTTSNDTRNKRSVWTVATAPFREAHFATFPPDLIEPCVLAGSRVGDKVLDPFSGSGTVGVVALSHQRNYEGIERNHEYVEMSRRRLRKVAPMFATEAITEHSESATS